MTITNCPTCGARCETWKEWDFSINRKLDFYGHLPAPNLVKLREAWGNYKNQSSCEWNLSNDTEQNDELVDAVKELLGTNE